MNLVIVGVGKVGETLVENLVNENHDVVVVDTDASAVSRAVNRHDVRGIVGAGLKRDVLHDAGAEKADFVIACMPRDEMNILCCVLAKKLGAKRTIARVRDPEYVSEIENVGKDLGLDFAFNPELTTAKEIAQVMKFPSALNVESFAGGKAIMAEFEVADGNPIVGMNLKLICRHYGNNILFAVVTRGDEVFIPHGDFILKKGDRVHVIASEAEIAAFCKKIKMFKRRSRSAFIIGGGKIAYYLSKELISSGVNVKIVEKDKARAEELSEILPSATVIFGNGTDREVLEEENLKSSDACVTLTGMDEENVMISLYAKQSDVDKIITKVDRPSVLSMVKMLGLDTVVTPRRVIANHILRFVRTQQSISGEGVDTLYKIRDKAEALEFTVGANFKGINAPLKELTFKRDVLIGGIVRDGVFILPVGDTVLMAGDRVIIVTAIKRLSDLNQILK